MARIFKKFHWLWLALGLLLIIPLLCFLFLMLRVYTYSSVNDPLSADAAIVLGAGVRDGRPSPAFEERIKHAVNLYKAGDVGIIIFTGGVGEEDGLTESEVARDYAIQHGVSAEHTYYETVSKNTYENLKEAKKITDQHNLTPILIVSVPLHMKRAVTIARDLGMDVYPSPTITSRRRTWKSKLRFLLRETYFYAKYLLRRPFLRQG